MIVTVTLNPSLDEWVHVPRLQVGHLHRTRVFHRYPAGKGINVSRVVHELGGRTTAVALAGGADGRILGSLLAQQGIPHRFVDVAGITRNNYQIQTDHPPAVTQINGAGPRVSARELAALATLLGRLQRTARCLVLSGSLPPGAPPHAYASLIRGLRAWRGLTVLDASGAALRQGLPARPWLIKPNRAEAEELLGRRLRRQSDVLSAARHLTARGPSLVLLSLGADGAVLAAAGSPCVWWATSPTVRVRSGVGAGDALVAGFVVGWLKTRSLPHALRLGVACGTATVMTPGTELCHAADVTRLVRRVAIRTLE